MLANSVIGKFFLKSIALYIAFVLLGSILGIDAAIGEIFRKFNNTCFYGLFENTTVEFQEIINSAFDTNIYIRYVNERQWNYAEFKMNSWYVCFIPNALFISLLLPTTYTTTKKKFGAFIIGLILTNMLLYWVLYIRVFVLKIQIQSSLGDFENAFSDKVVIFLHNYIAVYGWLTFVLPVFSWIAVSFSKEIFNRT